MKTKSLASVEFDSVADHVPSILPVACDPDPQPERIKPILKNTISMSFFIWDTPRFQGYGAAFKRMPRSAPRDAKAFPERLSEVTNPVIEKRLPEKGLKRGASARTFFYFCLAVRL
jgi:hypothetical protein